MQTLTEYPSEQEENYLQKAIEQAINPKRRMESAEMARFGIKGKKAYRKLQKKLWHQDLVIYREKLRSHLWRLKQGGYLV